MPTKHHLRTKARNPFDMCPPGQGIQQGVGLLHQTSSVPLGYIHNAPSNNNLPTHLQSQGIAKYEMNINGQTQSVSVRPMLSKDLPTVVTMYVQSSFRHQFDQMMGRTNDPNFSKTGAIITGHSHDELRSSLAKGADIYRVATINTREEEKVVAYWSCHNNWDPDKYHHPLINDPQNPRRDNSKKWGDLISAIESKRAITGMELLVQKGYQGNRLHHLPHYEVIRELIRRFEMEDVSPGSVWKAIEINQVSGMLNGPSHGVHSAYGYSNWGHAPRSVRVHDEIIPIRSHLYVAKSLTKIAYLIERKMEAAGIKQKYHRPESTDEWGKRMQDVHTI